MMIYLKIVDLIAVTVSSVVYIATGLNDEKALKVQDAIYNKLYPWP